MMDDMDPRRMIAERIETAVGVDGGDDDGVLYGEIPPQRPVDEAQEAAVRESSALDHSDTDNAKRLIIHFGRDLRVMALEGERNMGFLVWCGTHWDAKNGPDAAVRLAQKVGDLIQMEADFLTATPLEAEAIRDGSAAEAELSALCALFDSPEAPAMTEAQKARERALERLILLGKDARANLDKRKIARRKFGVSSKNKTRIDAMLSMAAPHLTREARAWNANAYRFASRKHTHTFEVTEVDGAIIRRHVVVEGHDRDDLITSILPVDYDPQAGANKFRRFMAAMLPDPAVQTYVQIFNGLGLTAIPIQKLLFHYGFGANGKSVFLEVIMRVLGDLGVTLAAETVSGSNERNAQGATPDLARLYGRRAVRIPELPKGQPLRESLVKTLTGGEAIPVRNLFKGAFEFVPVAKPQGSGNGYPQIDGSDYGMMRRISVIFWPVTVAEDERRDFNELVDDLMTEAAGVLNWLIDGALLYFDGGLHAPEGVRLATADLQAESDPVGQFKEACVVACVGAEVTGREMYQAYCAWCEASGIRPKSETAFAKVMKTKLKQREGRVRVYVDCLLSNVPERPAAPRHHSDE